jgi:hypothetical protein
MKKRNFLKILVIILLLLILILALLLFSVLVNGRYFSNNKSGLSPPQCSDGIDNDNDNYTDLLDLGCSNSEDDSENTEGSGTGTQHCREDFSQIDGNIIQNPYYACDELWEYGGSITPGSDNIPDYWGEQSPVGVWWVTNPNTHEKKWLTDETSPTLSKKVVLWHPKPEVLNTFPPFTHNDRKDGIGQRNETSFQTGRWYKFECTFKAENIMPIFNQSGDYYKTLYYNSEEIGCELRLYYTNGGYNSMTLAVNGPEGQTWNDTYGVYTTWTGGTTNGWVTKTAYMFVPEKVNKAYFHIINLGLANLTVAKMSFSPTPCNCDEKFPQFQKQGTIGFANFTGKEQFIIAYYGAPHRSGETISINELNDSGVNVIIKYQGYHEDIINPTYYYVLDPNALAPYNIYATDSIYGGAYRIDGNYIFNKSIVDSNFLGRNRSFLYQDERKTNFIGYWSDEPTCHYEGFLPDLREFHWLKQKRYIDLFTAAGKPPALAYIDFCGGNQDSDILIDEWSELADIISFTQNYPDYGPNAASLFRLDDLGAITRRIKDHVQRTQDRNIPIWAIPSVGFIWAPESWKNGDNINLTLLRFQIYNQIANGASGIQWFPMTSIDLNNPTENKMYQQVQEINFEIKNLREMLSEKQFYNIWDSSQYLEIIAKRYNGKWYLIATNPSYESKSNVIISLHEAGTPTSIKALFEDSSRIYNISQNRNINFNGMQFSDNFNAYDTHIYEIESDMTNQIDPDSGDDDDDNGPTQPCTPNWTCSDWGPCINNTQTTTCTDTNHCGVLTGKPNTIRTCNQSNLTGPDDDDQNQTEDDEITILPGINLPRVFVYSLIGIIFLGIIIIIVLIIQLRKKFTS